MFKRDSICAAVASLVIVPVSHASVTKYIVKDLGPGIGQAINNSGQVVGFNSNYHPFIYDNSTGKSTDLGTLTGHSIAYGINNLGEVAGTYNITTGFQNESFFLYSGGVMTSAGSGWAYGINDSGVIVGKTNSSQAFIYSNGTTTSINAALGSLTSQATAINKNGLVVGSMQSSPTAPSSAFTYNNGHVFNLGSLVQGSSYAQAVNNSGDVAGYYTVSSVNRAFIYKNSVVTDLGMLPGSTSAQAYGINSSDQVVGSSGPHPFLYSNGTISDLNNLLFNPIPGFTLQTATAINDRGQITGYGALLGQPATPEDYIVTPSSGTVLLKDSGSSTGNPNYLTLTVAGSNGKYASSVLSPGDLNAGTINITGIPNPVTDRPVIVLLDLLNSDSAFLSNLTSTDGTWPFTVISSASTGSDLAQWNTIKNIDGTSWTCAIRYDNFANPVAGHAMNFSWNFGINPGVEVDKIAVVPEPTSLSGAIIMGAMMIRRRKP